MTMLRNETKTLALGDNTRARQNTNKENALALAKVGVAVFPSSGKTPLIPLYNKLDTEISPTDREAAIEKYREDHDGKSPVHVGSTKSPTVVKHMWRSFQDAVPSIATGPSGLVVLDADAKDDGPQKMRAMWEDNGGLPTGALGSPTKSGGVHFIFADPDRAFTNKAGLLKKNYGTDVRGSGGQIVAPGSMLDDGRSYGTRDDLVRFLRAYVHKKLPTVPDYVAELIGTIGEHVEDNATPSKEREAIKALQETDLDQHENDFDETLGRYDLNKLKAENADFAKLYDNPSSDCSTNRFLAARHIMREWPDMPAASLSVFFSQWEGSGTYTDEKPTTGEYDDRQIAREWLKNQGLSKPSSGDAFGAVDDEQRDGYVRDSYLVANYKPIRWLVKRLIPLNSVGALYGLPNVGKSFVVFDLASHTRRERDWFGRKVNGGDVLYLYAEGAEGIAGRAKAWADNNDTSGGSVAMMNSVPNLFSDKKAAEKIIAAARKCEAESGQPVRLIIVDTLAAASTGADGSSDRDMGLVCGRLRHVATELDCAVLVVHHSGKDVTKGMRGSSATLGAVDYSLLVEEKDGASTLSAEKMRDARKGQSIKFKLVEVVIGVDEDGENVTSCIVRPWEAGAAMSAVDDDEEPPPLKVPDRREDRVAMLLDVAREEAEKAAAEEEPLDSVGLTAGALGEALNARRGQFCGLDGKPLTGLNREGVRRVVDTAVKEGKLVSRKSRVFLAP